MTAGRFDPAAHARAMRESGFWLDSSYDEFLVRAIADTPDKPALVAYRPRPTSARRHRPSYPPICVSRSTPR